MRHLTLALLAGLLLAAEPLWAQSTPADVPPEVLQTIRQYTGRDAKPIVPVALLNAKNPVADEVAKWLAAQRQQKLTTYSLQPKQSHYIGETEKNLQAAFSLAAEAGSVLFFEEADALFGKAAHSPEEEQWIKTFAQLAKKSGVAVLVHCTGEPAWYALAKLGFGIAKADLQ